VTHNATSDLFDRWPSSNPTAQLLKTCYTPAASLFPNIFRKAYQKNAICLQPSSCSKFGIAGFHFPPQTCWAGESRDLRIESGVHEMTVHEWE